MTNRFRTTSASWLALLVLCISSGRASAEGFTTAQVGWDTNCWYSGNDTDGDGLNQSCEQALANWFAPTVWFDNGEDTDGWWPHFAVKNVDYASKTISIAYLHSFYKDGGELFGAGKHDGDSEFVIIEVHLSGSTWVADWVYMSAHREAMCDSSQWYHYSQISWDSAYRGWASVFASENKHANYASDSQCDNACGGLENCDYDYWKTPTSDRNIGQSWGQLISVEQGGSAYEWYWDVNKGFCGWQRAGYYADHGGCSGSYYNHMQDFGY